MHESVIQALIGGPDTPHGHYYAPTMESIDQAVALLRSQAAELEALLADAEQLRLSLTFIVDRDLTYFDGYVDRHQIGMGAIEQARRVLKSDAAIDAARQS